MNGIISVISQCTTTIVLHVLTYCFFYHMYSLRYKNKLLYAGVFVVWTVAMILINRLGMPPLNLLYGIVTVNAICVKLFDASLKKSWLYNSLFLLIMTFSDMITVFVWSIIKGDNLEDILSNNQLMICSNLLNIIIMFLEYKIYTALLDKKDIKAIKIQEALFVLLMTIFESYVIYNFMWNVDSSRDGIVIIIILTGFLFFNIYITYIIHRVSEAYKYKFQLSLATRQNEIQLAHYKEMDRKYQESRCVIHDIKKHLSILNELESSGNPAAVRYGKLIEQEVDSLFCGFQCSNQIMSIVIGQKILSAESEGIKIKTKVEDISLDFMNELDITAIFANIWDNAIEACLKLHKDERYINFFMRKINGFIIINSENSFDDNLKKEKGKILSTKKNHVGIGLSIIKNTVEKYGGLFVTHNRNGAFTAEITIPVPVKNIKNKRKNIINT